jgi:hypothetical protein
MLGRVHASRQRAATTLPSSCDGPPMTLASTLVMLAVGVGLSAFCLWRIERPRPLGETRVFPAPLLLGVGLLLVLIALAHLLSLETGTTLGPRSHP